MDFSLAYLTAQWPALMRGLLMTAQVSAISIALSIAIGVGGAACRLLAIPLLSPLVAAYVEFIRNTPLLVQLFFIFFGLPTVGVKLSIFWSGVLCLTAWAGAFQVENVRGGLAAVGKGLQEAALSLGHRPVQFFQLVALPLAIRVSLPAMLNTSISLLKNSAYLQTIGLVELTFVAVDRMSMDFRAIEMFTAICAIYLVLVLALSVATDRLATRLQRPFRA
ncbi:MAG TPA: amino acid ABC transporter permease [Candidatus Methylomirabilis sp.]|nr:amino acid ABC transporter permease [Candidatus Methylomirabilis sp.]